MVLTRVLVLGLMTLSSGVRDGVELHGLHLESARGQISRTVPLKINAAIRHAKGLAASHLKELTAQQAEMSAKQAAAQKAAAKRHQLVDDVASHKAELEAQEEQARMALVALENSTAANDTKSKEFQAALGDWQGLSDEVKNLTKEVDDLELAKVAKLQAMEQDLEVRKQHLADKEASESKAKNTMIEKKADAEAAGKLREQHEQEKEKADAAMQAARAALEAQQKILEDAVSSLEVATAEAEKATSQTEHLAGIHRKQKDSLAMLLEVREAIKDFYTHMDALIMSMEKAAAKQPDMPAPQLLRGDSHLKPALESYNDVVKAFREAHSFDEGLYSTIRGAVPEIKQNSWSAILLQCDPGEILEKQAEEANNFDELQDKCGTGLWNAVGVQRLHFPTYQGTSEQLDEWWDQHVETPAAPASSAGSEEMVEEAEPVTVSEKILPEPDMHAPSTTKPEPVEQIEAEQEEEESVKAMPTTSQAAMEQPHSEAEDMDAFRSAETKEKEAEAVTKEVQAVAAETTTKEAEEAESIAKEVEALAVETTTKEAEEAESSTKEVEALAVETTTKEAEEAESITKEAEALAVETTTKEAEEVASTTTEVEAVAVETTTKEADDVESIMKELEAAESTTHEVEAVESTTKEVEAVEATTKEVEALESTTKKIHALESTTKNVEDLLSEMESLPASTSISSSLQPLPSNVKEDHHEATAFEIDDHEDTFSPSATTTTEALEGPEPDLMQDLSLL